MRPPIAVHRILALLGGVSVCVALAFPGLAADKIYKYVDQEGLVTYSSKPPAKEETASPVEELVYPGAPQPADVEAARKRAEENSKIAWEWLQARRKLDEEDARRRAAAIDLASQQAALDAYTDPTIDGPYYLPSYPLGWGFPSHFMKPPFKPGPPFVKHPKSRFPASLGPEPLRGPFLRRR